MKKFIKYLKKSHEFFVKESPKYVGIKKQDKSKPYPVFGYITDYSTKPFNPDNKVLGVSDIAYLEYYSFKFKDILYYPIAYIKFMYYCINDYIKK